LRKVSVFHQLSELAAAYPPLLFFKPVWCVDCV
jgi:hypothetical protein